MAKSELGTKRIDPETGRKFYDLNKDPIVSPYTGKSYPRSFFESGSEKVLEEEAEEEQEVEGEDDAPETISLEDADDEAKGGDDVPDMDDDDEDVKPQRSPEQREIQANPPTLDAETERRAAERRAAENRDDPA